MKRFKAFLKNFLHSTELKGFLLFGIFWFALVINVIVHDYQDYGGSIGGWAMAGLYFFLLTFYFFGSWISYYKRHAS